MSQQISYVEKDAIRILVYFEESIMSGHCIYQRFKST